MLQTVEYILKNCAGLRIQVLVLSANQMGREGIWHAVNRLEKWSKIECVWHLHSAFVWQVLYIGFPLFWQLFLYSSYNAVLTAPPLRRTIQRRGGKCILRRNSKCRRSGVNVQYVGLSCSRQGSMSTEQKIDRLVPLRRSPPVTSVEQCL
jgi:hypothetical protein